MHSFVIRAYAVGLRSPSGLQKSILKTAAFENTAVYHLPDDRLTAVRSEAIFPQIMPEF